MKTLITISFLFICFLLNGQNSVNNDNDFIITIPYVPAKLQLLSNSVVVSTTHINMGLQKISFSEIPKGKYKIQISGIGQLPSIIDSITVSEKSFQIAIRIDGPCLFDYPQNYIATCPQNHKDSIIPIIYGLITKRNNNFIKDQKDIKYKYAGCVSFGCDPKFYCKLHKIEF